MAQRNSKAAKEVKTVDRIFLSAWVEGWNHAAMAKPFSPGPNERFQSLATCYEKGRLLVVEARAAGLPIKPIHAPNVARHTRAPWPALLLRTAHALMKRGIDPFVEGRKV